MSDHSRREFLASSAAAALGAGTTGPLTWSAESPATLPAPRAVRGAEPVRLGVIGTGGMGTGHVEAFLNLAKSQRADVTIAALADVCQARLDEARAKVEAAQGSGTVQTFYANYPGLLAREDLHGVLIATPEHWHAKMVEDGVAAGKAVYVEKPMTLRLPEALRLHALVKANPQALVVVGTQFVMMPSYRKAQDLIAGGAIGKPVWSQTSYCRNSKDGEWLYAIDPAWKPGENLDWNQWCGNLGAAPWDPEVYARWRRYRKYSTGIIGDLLVHRITPLVMALNLGWPTRVVASGGHYVDKVMDNHDQVNLNIEFEGEHTMIVAGSTSNETGLETVVRGHKGNLYIGGARNAVLRPERIYVDEVDEQSIEGEDLGDSQDQLRVAWIEAIRSKGPSPSPVELGAKVMVAVDLATRSLWEGAAFAFDPKTMRARKL